MKKELPVYKLVIDDTEKESGVNYVALVDAPAIMSNWMAFSEQKERFQFNDEKQILSGAFMIPDLPIYRRDNTRGEYYVVFDRATIERIQKKFMSEGLIKNFNLMHEADLVVNDVYLMNSFIIDSEIGISTPSGFSEHPDGTWWGVVKVNNPDVWKLVKEKKLNGFSVEGFFDLIPDGMESEDNLIKQIEQILAS